MEYLLAPKYLEKQFLQLVAAGSSESGFSSCLKRFIESPFLKKLFRALRKRQADWGQLKSMLKRGNRLSEISLCEQLPPVGHPRLDKLILDLR